MQPLVFIMLNDLFVGMEKHPRVFISHASEDKERFVVKFAEKLREDGIDAWLDIWEISPGDSLVDKIFDKGLGQSDIVIMIISKYSVEKKWVKEELDSAVYNKIQGQCKIIPVIIDDCDVPESIKHTLWVKITDLNSYDDSYGKIRSAIFGQSKKPPLGKLPSYIEKNQLQIEDFTNADNFIVELICRTALEDTFPLFVNTSKILSQALDKGISKEEFYDTVELLDSLGYLKAEMCIDGKIPIVKVPTHLLEIYCKECVDDYENMKLAVISTIVNEKIHENGNIAAKTELPKSIVTHVLNYLDSCGRIRITTAQSGVVLVHPNSYPQLKRILR